MHNWLSNIEIEIHRYLKTKGDFVEQEVWGNPTAFQQSCAPDESPRTRARDTARVPRGREAGTNQAPWMRPQAPQHINRKKPIKKSSLKWPPPGQITQNSSLPLQNYWCRSLGQLAFPGYPYILLLLSVAMLTKNQ